MGPASLRPSPKLRGKGLLQMRAPSQVSPPWPLSGAAGSKGWLAACCLATPPSPPATQREPCKRAMGGSWTGSLPGSARGRHKNKCTHGRSHMCSTCTYLQHRCTRACTHVQKLPLQSTAHPCCNQSAPLPIQPPSHRSCAGRCDCPAYIQV